MVRAFAMAALLGGAAWAAGGSAGPDALFYYDLGPDQADVSRYPREQQANYRVVARACSRCHTLARALNAPMATRKEWRYYVYRMSVRAKKDPGGMFSAEEENAIVDFLAYDSAVRKGRGSGFQALTRELERRFDETIKERMGRLQRGSGAVKP